jgi:membrane-associated protease RseP (regulator of RpoE activity)
MPTASFDTLNLHPTAIGVWVGMFATALNLLPGGQLDGGHIIYGIWPRGHRLVSLLTVLALIPLIWQWTGWFVWGLLVAATGLRHPPVPAEPGIGGKRVLLALFAVLMFVLTFVPVPFAGMRPTDIIQQYRQSH